MSLFQQLDKSKTKLKAKKKLQEYRVLRQISGETFTPKVTTTYSFEPRSSSGIPNNAIEKHIVRKVTAQQKLIEIETAINKLDAYDRLIIIKKYCESTQLDVAIYMEMELSETEFYRQLDKALYAFAEVYRYGELLVFENGLGIDEILGEV